MSIDFNEEFFFSVTSGAISLFPSYVGREQDAGVYDFFQSIDRVAFRLLKEIRMKRMLKVVRTDDLESLSGQDLINFSEMLGLPFFENYIYKAFKQRMLTWAKNPEGGTQNTIKRSLFFYIGEEAFTPLYDPDTGSEIVIEDIELLSGTAVWGTTAGSTDEEGLWGDFIWADENAGDFEDFVVKITFVNSGSSTDRGTYQYWNLDANRVSLQRIIDSVKPAGFSNTLKILQGF